MLYHLDTQFVFQRHNNVFNFGVTVVFERLCLAVFEEDFEHIRYRRNTHVVPAERSRNLGENKKKKNQKRSQENLMRQKLYREKENIK